MPETAAIILAAGKSTRMKSDLPKVLHEICGRPMLSFVLRACRLAGVDRLLVVVGHGREKVVQAFEGESGDITWVYQGEQKGTGHAVLCCREALGNDAGSVLVIAGDMPLIRRETLAELLAHRERSGDAVTIATTNLADPTGYGRIIRDAQGRLEGIIEHRHCTPEQRAIAEVNPSYYCFDAKLMMSALRDVQPDSAAGEIFITEAIRILKSKGHGVSAQVSAPAEDAMGINSRLDLATVGRAMQDRIQYELMAEGVTIVDPDNTWIEVDAVVGRDTVIQPFSFIGAAASIGTGCRIGPFATIGSAEVVDDGAVVGPALPGGVALT
jgi:bifunctional UDP-N-acetylglucosamine pyrophosphorylase/glucosamine-1-phosphate N-acetyltransferase